MTPDQRERLQLKVRLFPWVNVALILGAIGIVAIMLTTPEGRTQVLTSFIATGALVLFWPVVKRRLAQGGGPRR